MYLTRTLGPVLDNAMDHFPVVMVTGPRQAGKTTFVRHRLPDATYLSLDDPAVSSFAREDPRGFLASHARPVVLDEIQQVPELLPSLKVAVDADRGLAGQFLLTGSQQFSLMHRVSESLAGRVAILDLLPLSFEELGPHAGGTLAEVIWRGGYPEPALNPAMRTLWIASYLRTYIERDVRALLQVADLKLFESLLNLVAANHGQETNFAKLATDVGVAQPTIKRWLGVLEASYVLHALRPYHKNFGKRLVRSAKTYFIDPALVCHLTRLPTPDAALAGPLAGPLFEGWCVSEALKVFSSRGLESDIFFWRSHDGLEVDLLVMLSGKLLPIEVKRTGTPTSAHVRGLSRFCGLAGADAHPSGWLVCDIDKSMPMAGGHEAVPWFEFPGRLAERLAR